MLPHKNGATSIVRMVFFSFWLYSFFALPLSMCGLDLRLALSGRRFGVDGNTALQVLLERSQPEACLMTRAIAANQVVADTCASQAISLGFSTSRQTYNPIAPNLRPIHTMDCQTKSEQFQKLYPSDKSHRLVV